MSLAASRAVLRRHQWVFRRTPFRNASTTSEAANAASSGATKAKDSASEVTSKASAGLSRVTSSAGPALKSATEATSHYVSSIGGRTGNAINFVTCEFPIIRVTIALPPKHGKSHRDQDHR